MPVRQPPITDVAVRVLLNGIVDYAGLFPPAAVGMATAVRNFAHYRASGNGWMLGRFVCPATALVQFSEEADQYLPRDAGAIGWHLSVTGSGDVPSDMAAISAFNERHKICWDECSATVDTYETRARSMGEVRAIHATVPNALCTFIEVPVNADPTELLREIANTGRRAKIRTGGVTANSFPTSNEIARFLEACALTGVTAKATAGLHHPLRGVHSLTYEANAPHATMYGYINMFLASALVACEAPRADVVAMLEEQNGDNITFSETHCQWSGGGRPYTVERGLLARMREHALVSFGSCSFTEPVNETHELSWI